MPLKPIIDIAVDDTKFKEFLALFEKYRDAVSNLPQGWQGVNAAVEKSGAGFGEMTAALLAQAEILHRLGRETEEFERSTGRVARAFSGVSSAARSTLGHVAEISRHFLRWGEIGGIFSGLAGVGSLFGLERLASSASSLRTGSLSRGTNPAAEQALRVNFGSFANPTSGLSNIVNLQSSLQGQVAFNALGIPGDFSADPARAYTDAIGAIRQAYRSTPAGQRQNAPWWQYATQILSPEEIRTFGNMGDQEFSQRVNSAQRDQQRFAYRPGELKAWQDFDIQLSRAGNAISHDFLGALEKLTGPLSDLSGAAVKLIGDFLNSQLLKDAIDALTQGIGWLDQKLNDGSFQKGFEAFGADLDIIVKGLGGFASFITDHPILFGLGDLNSQPPAATIGPDGRTLIVPNGPMGVPGAGYQPWNPLSWSREHNPIFGSAHAAPMPGFGGADISGANPDLIPIIQRESGGKPLIGWGGMPGSPDYSPGGTDLSGYPLDLYGFPNWPGKMGPAGISTAAGLYQITRSTWDPIAAKLGVHDFSVASQNAVANELYRERGFQPWDASGRPPGPETHRYTAYPGASGGHDQWLSAAKMFVEHMRGGKPFVQNRPAAPSASGGAQQIKVTVDNNTGGSAIVSAAQMPIAI